MTLAPLHAVSRVMAEEVHYLRPRRVVALSLARLLPDLVGNRVRTWLLRLGGLSIGSGTAVGGALTVVGRSEVRIGRDCWLNAGSYIDVSAPVSIGDGVAIAQRVMILTNTHLIGGPDRRAGLLDNRPVSIGSGCWLGAGAVVLPGVSIGRGSIVAAGAVVASDVEPNTLVGGVPASVIRRLSADA